MVQASRGEDNENKQRAKELMSHLPNLVQWGSYFENPFPLVGHHEGCIECVFLTALLHKGVMVCY